MKATAPTLLKVGSLASFFVAYQLAAHGVTLKAGVSLGIGYALFVLAVLLLVAAIWIGRKAE